MRNTYSPEFKAKVVREVLREDKRGHWELAGYPPLMGVPESAVALNIQAQALKEMSQLE